MHSPQRRWFAITKLEGGGQIATPLCAAFDLRIARIISDNCHSKQTRCAPWLEEWQSGFPFLHRPHPRCALPRSERLRYIYRPIQQFSPGVENPRTIALTARRLPNG